MSDEEAKGVGTSLRHFAITLFNGYGYNFYREENQLRADDQRVRRMVSELLQRARKALSDAEARYRRERFPAPSRANPFPPADMQADARVLEGLAGAVSALDARIGHLPVPGNDFMTQRYRKEADTLRRLGELDLELVERAQALNALVEEYGLDDLVARHDEVERGIRTIEAKLMERQAVLA